MTRDVHIQSALSNATASFDAVHGVLALSLAKNELVIDIIAVLADQLAGSQELRTEGANFCGLGRHGTAWSGLAGSTKSFREIQREKRLVDRSRPGSLPCSERFSPSM